MYVCMYVCVRAQALHGALGLGLGLDCQLHPGMISAWQNWQLARWKDENRAARIVLLAAHCGTSEVRSSGIAAITAAVLAISASSSALVVSNQASNFLATRDLGTHSLNRLTD